MSVRCLCGGGCLRSQLAVVVLLVWVVCGGLFVICIVVASIFVLYCFLCFVSLLVDSVDALASRADEGR